MGIAFSCNGYIHVIAVSIMMILFLIIDDLIATGGTAKAAAELIEKSGGKVAGFIFVINLFDLKGTKLLETAGYKTFSLMDFPGH